MRFAGMRSSRGTSSIDIYLGEETLLARIGELQASDEDIPEELAELVQRYVDGWRPSTFGNRDDPET